MELQLRPSHGLTADAPAAMKPRIGRAARPWIAWPFYDGVSDRQACDEM